MNSYLPILVFIPLVGLLLSLLPKSTQEKALFRITVSTIGLHVIAMVSLLIQSILYGEFPMYNHGYELYSAEHTDFAISMYFDATASTYGIVAGIITFLITFFSRYYLHREKGYKRFFNNLLFFYLGLNIIIFSGNFETLFIGWEVIGITSFFLIAFYRDRYLPVKNALKVVSLYRIADILLLLAIWACHHIFEHSLSFQELYDLEAHHLLIINQPVFQLIIPGLFLAVALVKSAQAPFSSWLSRAMEGPTTSSAIFYGSLSVHIGLFLLIRTYPFWEDNFAFRAIVFVLGLVTVIISTTTARVQSSVKTQIAYSSVAQIGIMFIEVACGGITLALIHFASNAFLRTFQLLVSPSVLHYLITDQFFNFNPPQKVKTTSLWDKIKLSIYVLSIKEWNLDTMMYRYLWQPVKKAGNQLQLIPLNSIYFFFIPIFMGGLFFVYHQDIIPVSILHYLSEIFSLLGLLMVLKAFTERKNAIVAWGLVVMNQLFMTLSIGFNERFDFTQVHIYLSGIVVSAIIGFWSLNYLKSKGEQINLDGFHGMSYERPRLSNLFLIACLGISGFPITPTFIGEDLILGHIHEKQIVLTVLTAINLVLDGLAIFRVYARIFLGPHDKPYHEVAYRSA